MIKSTFEEEIERSGKIIYSNKGVSMMPLIKQGRDLMVIEKKGEGRLRRYDAPLFKRENGQYVLHRILKVRENDYVLCGDHQWIKEYGITDDQIIGVLTAVIRKGRMVPVTKFSYRMYVHLWCDFFWVRALILKGKYYAGAVLRKLHILKRHDEVN